MQRDLKLNIHDVWIGICMFIVVFNPPIFSFNLIHVVALSSWLYILTHGRTISLYVSKSDCFKLSFVLIVFLVFISLSAIVHSNPVVRVAIDFIYWIFEIIPFCIYATARFRQRKWNIENVLGLMVNVGVVQAIMAVLAFIIPFIHDFFLQRMVAYGYEASLTEDLAYRQYGFATDMVSYSAFYLSFVACVALNFYFSHGRVINLVKMALLIFASVINARTGVVIFIAGAIVIFTQKRTNQKKSWRILSLLLIALAVPMVLSFISKGNEDTMEWLIDGYKDIERLLNGSVGGSTSFFYYYSTFWKLPSDILTLLFGTGCQMMGGAARAKYGFATDVGFINDIWKWGIPAMLCLYVSFLRLWNKNMIQGGHKDTKKFLYRLLLVSFLIVNLKGLFFVKHGLSTLCILCAIFMKSEKQCKTDSITCERIEK